MDPCHYNYSSLLICHYYSSYWIHTTTISKLPEICHYIPLQRVSQNLWTKIPLAFFFLSSPTSFLSLYTAGSLLVPPPLSRGGAPAGRRARGAATGPRGSTVEPLHRRRPPSRLPTFLPGAPARWPRRAGGGLARARARRVAAGGRAQLWRPGSRWPANGGVEPHDGLATAARLAMAGTAPPPCVPSPSRPPLPEQQRSAGGGMAWRRWRLGAAPRGGGPLSSQAASHGGSARFTPGRQRQSASPGRPRPGGRRTRGGGRWRARRWREVGDPGDVEE